MLTDAMACPVAAAIAAWAPAVMLAMLAALAAAAAIAAARRRDAAALPRLDGKIRRYRAVRLALSSEILTRFASSLAPDDMLRMRRIISSHPEAAGEQGELRWERAWAPEMRRVMRIIDQHVGPGDRRDYEDAAHAMESNERMLAEALAIRRRIAGRAPSAGGDGAMGDGGRRD